MAMRSSWTMSTLVEMWLGNGHETTMGGTCLRFEAFGNRWTLWTTTSTAACSTSGAMKGSTRSPGQCEPTAMVCSIPLNDNVMAATDMCHRWVELQQRKPASTQSSFAQPLPNACCPTTRPTTPSSPWTL